MDSRAKNTSSFHGYKILGLAVYSQIVAIGCSVYIYGLFIEPVSETFNTSRGAIGWGPTILFLTSSSLAPIIGRYLDRGKVRQMMLLGSIFIASGLCLLSVATSLVQMALILSLMVGVGVGCLGPLPCSAMVVNWFRKRRGFALGLSATGASLGGFLLPPLTAMLITDLGWQQCLLALGIAIALTLIPAVWFLSINKPEDIGQHPDGDKEAVTTLANAAPAADIGIGKIISSANFWFIGLTISLINGTGAFCVTYMVPFARELGVTTEFGAVLVSVLAGCSLTGKFVFGYLCDRISPQRVLINVILGFMLGWTLLIMVNSVFDEATKTGLVIATMVMGLSLGGLLPGWNTLVAKVYSQDIFARVLSSMYLLSTPFILLPGPLGGYGFDYYQSYLPIFKAGWFVFPLMLILACFIKVPRNEVPAAATA
ncbi:MFS transporter [Parahaliea mediterranea]|uniref:MFS transporter n=1 Tax=Parahaliea mediterranea TaxID=651086 RepID=A0A939DEU8_9GAMM|nr:MFS transporter [Parahaliea mediterranea]MBN7796896.1 MFS transporter [Parahaliea mediterranea]